MGELLPVAFRSGPRHRACQSLKICAAKGRTLRRPPPVRIFWCVAVLLVFSSGLAVVGGEEAFAQAESGAEPARVEPVGAEPARVEPVGAEPVGVEPVGVEPVGVEPVGVEPVGAESVEAEPAGAESVEAESARVEPAEVEPAGVEPAGVESAGVEPAGVESVDAGFFGPPWGLSVVSGVGEVSVSWQVPGDGRLNDGYVVEYRLLGETGWARWAGVVHGAGLGVSEVSVVVSGLREWRGYEFRVGVAGESGSVAWSSLVRVPVLGAPLHHWALDGGDGGGLEPLLVGDERLPRLVRGSWLGVGRVGAALRLSGDGYLDMGTDAVSGASDWSAGLWVRRMGSTGGSVLFAPAPGGGGEALLLEAPSLGGRLGLGDLVADGLGFSYSVPLGRWVHLVFVGSSSGVSLYVNGVFTDRLEGAFGLPLRRLGAGFDGTGGVEADVDDVRVYERALSAEEVAGLFGSFPPPPASPGVPLEVSASPADGEVVLSWSGPESDGGYGVSGFEVRRRQAESGEWSGWVKRGPSAGTHEFSGLVNGREYLFQVRAVNAVGRGSWSEVGSVPGVAGPPGQPRELSVSPGSGLAIVSWSAPGTDGGAEVSGYEVRYRGFEEEGEGPLAGWSGPVLLRAGGRHHTVLGLVDGEDYEVQVRAQNRNGAGPWAEARVKPSGTPTPPATPRGLSVVSGRERAVLSWSAPGTDGGAEVSGYEVRYQRGTFRSEPVGLDASVRGHEFSGLVHGTDHLLMVRAVNAVDAGRWAAAAVGFGLSNESAPVIPRLRSWTPGSGVFSVSETSRIVVAAGDEDRHWGDDFLSAVLGVDGVAAPDSGSIGISAGHAIESGQLSDRKRTARSNLLMVIVPPRCRRATVSPLPVA